MSLGTRVTTKVGAGAVAAAIAVPLMPVPAGADEEAEAAVAFNVTDPRITEASGLAVSRRHSGVFYTHNDSGGTAQIFAVGPDGRTRAAITLAGANARDWEGMATGRDEAGRPAIYVADIGDNLGGAWPYVTVYRIPEPSRLHDQTIRATAFRLKYADGPRNAESVLIHPRTNRLYVASKLFSGALYAAPATLRAGRTNTLRKVGDAPPIATDGAFAPDGRTYVIRTYLAAHVYSFSGGRPGRQLRVLSLPRQEQGESITYSPDGRFLFAGSEGTTQPVWRITLPAEARPADRASEERAAGDASGQQKPGTRGKASTTLALVAALSVGAAIGFGVLRRRR